MKTEIIPDKDQNLKDLIKRARTDSELQRIINPPRGLDVCFMIDNTYVMNSGHCKYFRAGIRKTIDNISEDEKVHRYSAISFSGETRFSGWKQQTELDEVLEIVNSIKCDGDSRLNISIADKILANSDPFILVAISAADKQIAEQLEHVFRKVKEAGNKCVLYVPWGRGDAPKVFEEIADVYSPEPEDFCLWMPEYVSELIEGEK
jgi:hypothetical protein